MNAEIQQYLTTEEVATVCRVRRNTVMRWISQGILPSARLGHRVLVPVSAVTAALQADAGADPARAA